MLAPEFGNRDMGVAWLGSRVHTGDREAPNETNLHIRLTDYYRLVVCVISSHSHNRKRVALSYNPCKVLEVLC